MRIKSNTRRFERRTLTLLCYCCENTKITMPISRRYANIPTIVCAPRSLSLHHMRAHTHKVIESINNVLYITHWKSVPHSKHFVCRFTPILCKFESLWTVQPLHHILRQFTQWKPVRNIIFDCLPPHRNRRRKMNFWRAHRMPIVSIEPHIHLCMVSDSRIINKCVKWYVKW